MHACCTGILFRCVPEFLTVHLDTVPVHSGMIRGQEDRLARQIKQWQPDTPTSQLYQITPQRARFIPRNFHTRGRERASGSLPADSENNKSLVLPIRRGSGRRPPEAATQRSGTQRRAKIREPPSSRQAGAPPPRRLPCFHRSAPPPKNIPTHQILAPLV